MKSSNSQPDLFNRDPSDIGKALGALKNSYKKNNSQYQLPNLNENQRLTSNCLSRSSLFTIQKPTNDREFFHNLEVFSSKGYKIIYKGELLTQYDLDVFITVLHQFKSVGLSNDLNTSINSLLTDMSITNGGKEYNRVRESLHRLSFSHITVTFDVEKKFDFRGTLISFYKYDQEASKSKKSSVLLRVQPEIASLFQPSMYSLVDWSFHSKLSTMAKFLHCFYLSHKKPLPYSIEKIKNLSGSKSNSPASFKQKLILGLEELKPKVISQYMIIDNNVHVYR